MKKLMILAVSASFMAACGAKQNNESSVKDFTVITNPSDTEMHAAAKALSSDLKSGLYPVAGVEGVAYGDCSETWIPNAHGHPTPAIFTPPYKGLVVTFKTEEALKNFASSAQLFGDKVRSIYIGQDQAGKDQFVAARLCGVLDS